MEIKEQIKQNTHASEKQGETKKPYEALSEDALEPVSGGMKILQGDETAATKGFLGER